MKYLFVLATLLASTSIYAASGESENMMMIPDPIVGEPEPVQIETIEKVKFITGGIGKEEMGMFETQASQNNLQIKVTLTTGHYISDVWITVENAAGEILLKTEMDGPLLYTNLEPGKYTVTGSWKDQNDVRKTTIAKEGHREIFFRFKPEGEQGLDQRGVE